MASKFSIAQTIMQLSFLSRTTSISYSFQPINDSSINNSLVGDKSKPRLHISSNSSELYAIPPPEPPIVKEGRIITGKPKVFCTACASSNVWAISERGVSKPIAFMALSNKLRSSALSIASRVAPIICTPCFSNTPSRARSSAQFKAVCPPMVGKTTSGFSFSIILATVRHSTGSI